ncbi:methyltransferase regulatory domain-containing protein [Atlantibacter sp.]|uniref:O-linked N-acetylglucosamine transferase family protein n=1 Tax=Atlantibacter sp. TaxID=1903473 RepID=UPI00289D1B6E|nr:methyltransferase regulatory domain-containing protein [Atlantibacter sp.]
MTTTVVPELAAASATLPNGAALPLNGRASPQYLRAVAKMYGVETPALGAARVLVLGCDTGANLLPFCSAWPHATAIGIDIDPQSIEQGQALIARSGIANLNLYCLQLDELLSVSPGEQDYIILQGMFTLLDNATREAVLAWCRQHLSPSGLISVQWSCYPGARSEETLRDAFLLHSSLATSEEEKIDSARAAATWLSLGMAENNPQRATLLPLLADVNQQNDTQISLKYLSGLNEASYLVDFNEMVERNGLAYVGDAEPWTELPAFYGASVAQMHQAISPQANKIVRQQYLDFAVNRQHRFSLLVGEQHKASVLPQPDKQQFKSLNWAGNFQRLFRENQAQNTVITPEGSLITTDHELTLRVLDLLGEVWPLSLSFMQIALHTALPEEKDDSHTNNVLNVLWSLFVKGSRTLFTCSGPCPYSLSTNQSLKLLPGLVSLNDPEYPERLGFNFWHQSVEFTKEEYAFIADEALNIESNTLAVCNFLHRKGVLTGSVRAWQKYFQHIITMQTPSSSVLNINSLMVFTHYGMEEAFRITHAIKSDARARQKHAGNSLYEDVDERINKKLNQLINQGNNVGACELAESLIMASPDNPHVWHRRSQVYAHQDRYSEALKDIVKAIAIEPTQWAFYYDYATQLWRLQHYWMAEKIARYCLRFNTTSAKLWALLCALAKEKENFEVAENCARKALSINPAHTTSLSNMGVVLSAQSRLEEAIPWLHKAHQSAPHELVYFTNYLFGLLHSPTIGADYLFAEHQRFGRTVSRWAKQQGVTLTHSNNKDPQRRLRIGFVSGDLGLHPVTNFIRPIWDALNSEQFALYAYQTSSRNDGITEQLKQKSERWCEAQNMSALELAKRIHYDEIDIAIDLSGHTDYNRLAAFGLKPAPISMSFIGYLGTTGLAEMDYYMLHEKIAQPGQLESQFTEALIYLPFNQPFALFLNAPDVTPAPALSNKVFTFGSFNRTNKINDVVLYTWAEILKRCENSRMLIGSLTDEKLTRRYLARFAELGIDESRLIMRRRTSMPEYMQMHNEVDLLLDTFPYPGGTTANYGLQMGVPSLTLAGETPIMCQGAAGMRQYDLDEFVVNSREEYIARAVEIAADVHSLNEIRLALRERIAEHGQTGGSPAAYFEAALREAWKRYCRGEVASSFSVKDYMVR